MNVILTDPSTWPTNLFLAGEKELKKTIDANGILLTKEGGRNRKYHLECAARDVFIAMLEEALRSGILTHNAEIIGGASAPSSDRREHGTTKATK